MSLFTTTQNIKTFNRCIQCMCVCCLFDGVISVGVFFLCVLLWYHHNSPIIFKLVHRWRWIICNVSQVFWENVNPSSCTILQLIFSTHSQLTIRLEMKDIISRAVWTILRRNTLEMQHTQYSDHVGRHLDTEKRPTFKVNCFYFEKSGLFKQNKNAPEVTILPQWS